MADAAPADSAELAAEGGGGTKESDDRYLAETIDQWETDGGACPPDQDDDQEDRPHEP